MSITVRRWHEIELLCGDRVRLVLKQGSTNAQKFAAVKGPEIERIAENCGLSIADIQDFAWAEIAKGQPTQAG